MSRKITEKEFLRRFYQRFPDAKIEIINYYSLKKPTKIRCQICGKEFERSRAEGFLSSWPCCEGHNESKVQMIKRICDENGHYKFIKQADQSTVIIKHLDCGNELTKSIGAAVNAPCSCQICNAQSQKLRISKEEAQKQLDKAFENRIELLYFDGVDSSKSQFRCLQCGLIFNQKLYNFITKCRGCPKCDQRRSKGERAMREWLEKKGFDYEEQVRFSQLGRLSFDFGIKQNDKIIALIEVQGEQHYQEVFHYPSRPGYYLTQQEHDQQKRDFCKENSIPLYEIINNSGKLKNLEILSNLLSSTTISEKESTL